MGSKINWFPALKAACITTQKKGCIRTVDQGPVKSIHLSTGLTGQRGHKLIPRTCWSILLAQTETPSSV